MKKNTSHIGLACELLNLLAAVLTVVHAVMQLMGLAVNYRENYAAILQA